MLCCFGERCLRRQDGAESVWLVEPAHAFNFLLKTTAGQHVNFPFFARPAGGRKNGYVALRSWEQEFVSCMAKPSFILGIVIKITARSEYRIVPVNAQCLQKCVILE